MLAFLSVLMMLIVAYAHWREGLFTALCYCINVVLAGLIAFSFFEPLADVLDSSLRGSLLEGYEDFLVLVFLFGFSLGMLRLITNNLCPNQVEFTGYFQQAGGAAFGLVTGYLAAGFMICMLQTLPWHRNFMSFEPRGPGEGGLRSFLPPDRAWLSLMRYAGAHSLCWEEDRPDADDPYDRYVTFDRHGNFELRYFRHRRYSDREQTTPYYGEFGRELHKK